MESDKESVSKAEDFKEQLLDIHQSIYFAIAYLIIGIYAAICVASDLTTYPDVSYVPYPAVLYLIWIALRLILTISSPFILMSRLFKYFELLATLKQSPK